MTETSDCIFYCAGVCSCMVLQDIEPDVYVAFPELLSRVSILLLSGKNPRSTLTVKKEACFYLPCMHVIKIGDRTGGKYGKMLLCTFSE